jgi:sugar-specific transcriptional regulator TrmB
MFEDLLNKIGFSESEAKVYLELLNVGTQAVSVIAKRVSLNRSTTYSVLRSLQARGVVGFYKRNAISYFSACDPNCLLAYIDSKCKTFEYYRLQFLSAIPRFRSTILSKDLDVPVVNYFEGVEGVNNLVSTIFESTSRIDCYLNPERWFTADLWGITLRKMKLHSSKFPIRALIHRVDSNFEFTDDEFANLSFRFLADCDFFLEDLCIFDEGIAVISLDPAATYAILIKSLPLAKMQLAIFNRLFLSSINEKI